jgi:hypothetical protein
MATECPDASLSSSNEDTRDDSSNSPEHTSSSDRSSVNYTRSNSFRRIKDYNQGERRSLHSYRRLIPVLQEARCSEDDHKVLGKWVGGSS